MTINNSVLEVEQNIASKAAENLADRFQKIAGELNYSLGYEIEQKKDGPLRLIITAKHVTHGGIVFSDRNEFGTLYEQQRIISIIPKLWEYEKKTYSTDVQILSNKYYGI